MLIQMIFTITLLICAAFFLKWVWKKLSNEELDEQIEKETPSERAARLEELRKRKAKLEADIKVTSELVDTAVEIQDKEAALGELDQKLEELNEIDKKLKEKE